MIKRLILWQAVFRVNWGDSLGVIVMYKFIIATFLMLGWGFYEMSGGADFEPEQVAFAEPQVEEPAAATGTVTLAVTPVAAPAVEALPAQDALVTEASLEVPAVSVEEPTAPASLTNVIAEAAETSLVIEPVVESSTLSFEPVEIAAATDVVDLRAVAGSRVNMRSGPGTDYGVLDTLPRGTETEVLEVDATGWARIRVIGSGQIGWMAERLLTTL